MFIIDYSRREGLAVGKLLLFCYHFFNYVYTFAHQQFDDDRKRGKVLTAGDVINIMVAIFTSQVCQLVTENNSANKPFSSALALSALPLLVSCWIL